MSLITQADVDKLAHASPALAQTSLGARLLALQTAFIDLQTKHNALAAKLDADAGVTDTNYVANDGVTVLT